MAVRPDPVREDVNAKYDRIRCRCCGYPWEAFTDPATGVVTPAHPQDTQCNRYRPQTAPSVPVFVLQKIDDEAKARGELVGTVTGEWDLPTPQRNGHA